MRKCLRPASVATSVLRTRVMGRTAIRTSSEGVTGGNAPGTACAAGREFVVISGSVSGVGHRAAASAAKSPRHERRDVTGKDETDPRIVTPGRLRVVGAPRGQPDDARDPDPVRSDWDFEEVACR